MNIPTNKQFARMCQQVAILPAGVFGKRDVPADLVVWYDKRPYSPKAYELSFDDKGCALHSAILRDLVSNSVIVCRMKDCLTSNVRRDNE